MNKELTIAILNSTIGTGELMTPMYMAQRLRVCAEEMAELAMQLEAGDITKLSQNEFVGAGTHHAAQTLLEIKDEEY